jgi:D-alanine transaminase
MNPRAHSRRAPPGRIAYVDGRYVPHRLASVHIEDRGLQFADSVYEVFFVSEGRLMDQAPHLDRLERSLGAIGMTLPVSRKALLLIMQEVVRRNRLTNGFLYLQMTRGVAARDHAATDAMRPLLILTARAVNPNAIEKRRAAGVAVVTTSDIRWGRCDIKTTALLPNVLAKTEARRRGAYEAWFVDRDGLVTEGASTNAWIVDAGGTAITRSIADNILPGVTRRVVLDAAAGAGITIEERGFSLEEAHRAHEAFITSATGGVMPVIRIDDATIGEGAPGPVAARMQALYRALSAANAVS